MLNTQTQERSSYGSIAQMRQQQLQQQQQQQQQQQLQQQQLQRSPQQQNPLRPSVLNSTYDGEQHRQVAPPRTLPPADLSRQMLPPQQAQPPLSAAALQKHQNSLALQ